MNYIKPIPMHLLTNQKFLERFWSKVLKADGCWLWQGTRDDHGYGTISVAGSEFRASRISYAIAFGDPGKLNVLHSCDNPPCVKPNDLFLGTDADNVRDAFSKGRRGVGVVVRRRRIVCKRGHPLTPENSDNRNRCIQCKRERNRLWMRGYKKLHHAAEADALVQIEGVE
jgi:hypothetical protein